MTSRMMGSSAWVRHEAACKSRRAGPKGPKAQILPKHGHLGKGYARRKAGIHEGVGNGPSKAKGYVRCRVWRQGRRKRYVLIAGRWSSKEYTNKDGEQRTWNELRIEHIEILSDGFREAVVDAMTTAMSKILTLGRYDEKRDFVKAFNLSFVDAFWNLCQEMQGEAAEESADGDGYGADDYEMTI